MGRMQIQGTQDEGKSAQSDLLSITEEFSGMLKRKIYFSYNSVMVARYAM